ncbi:inactive receptor kinase [Pyrus ussuriensis x Pyrus communis]|uniref:Inactive receptor kinase n=1 Tax=Pyrus ussuriensis x Pyrus communis TaxID=2448454 RepID=A0A5N5I5F7_9ROSA|nr:inactive receptor kinase [Pyrus ussuriensis x Pyrus communis]
MPTGAPCFMSKPSAWYGIQQKHRPRHCNYVGQYGTQQKHQARRVHFTELLTLSLKNNSLWGNIMDFSLNPKLTHIDMSDNILHVEISPSLLSLGMLDGLIPTTHALQAFGYDSFSGNAGLCGPPSSILCNSSRTALGKLSSSKDKFNVYLLLLDAAGLVVVILLFLIYYKKSQKGKLEFVQHGADDNQIFEMRDLLKSSAESLGNGIFGNSYKAEIVTMNNVAGKQIKQYVVVKRLRNLKPLVSEDFTKQLQLLANLKHPNLLPLLAYYFSKDERLLLYKCVQKGNLFNRVFGNRGANRIPFRWRSRLLVARGVARALKYLHNNETLSVKSSNSTSTTPHGNLKLSNVLLDDSDGVLVSDYGFASLVAIPIATQRMVIYKSSECQNTTNASNTAKIFDMEITMHRTASNGMLRLLQIAMSCCDPSPEKRPGMHEIVRELENIRVTESKVEGEGSSLDQSLTDESVSVTALPARFN